MRQNYVMNFLAHLYLTRDLSEETIIGNFIADAIKGKRNYALYSLDIQRGMDIHREIDHFADLHPEFKKGTSRLNLNHGKYSGIVLDILYDHILAQNWVKYHQIELSEFAQSQYLLINKHEHLLPEFTKYWFQVMRNDNLLTAYADESGIEDVLDRMDQRIGKGTAMRGAIKELQQHKSVFTEEFSLMFHDMQNHLAEKFPELKR